MEVIYNLFFNILLWTSLFEFTHQKLYQMDPDFGLTTEDIIKKYNYSFEKYTIQTEDGYILEIHRISNTKFKNKMRNSPPILLYSGFLGDSGTWVSLGPKRGLGFILANHGYDVWMGNNRGSTLCKKHVSLDPRKNKKKFWNFSFQELGYYDTPATIDHILNVTKQEQLIYIGYSQGTSSYFAMLSEKPNYNHKIKFAIALAPVTSLQNCPSAFVNLLVQNQRYFKNLTESLNMYELLPHTKQLVRTVIEFCSPYSSYQNFCAQLVSQIIGVTMNQLNMTTFPMILSNALAGASMKEGFHLLQLSTGLFRKYNYGKRKNLKEYGQEDPPMYNFSKVNVPTAFIYGSYDVLASQKDVELLAPKIPNIVGMKLIPKFNHVDLGLGIDAPRLVFPKILKFLKKYS